MKLFKHKLLLLVAVCTGLRGQDAREIVRKSLDNDERASAIARNYTFIELNVDRQYEKDGKLKSTRSRTFDVTIQEQSPYRRLVARDGKPLNADEEAKEQAKLQRSIDERRRETPEQRTKRLAEWEKRRERQRRFVREIPDAFSFTLQGSRSYEGRDVWVIRAEPKTDYRARTNEGRLLSKFAGTLWIDKVDLQWARVEARVVDTIAIGWLLARVAPGASLEVEQTRVNDEVWLPKHVLATYRVRLGLVKLISGQNEMTYSRYRKFQAESHFVPDVASR